MQITGYFDEQSADYRVPSWDGTGGAIALPIFEKRAEAYIRSLKTEDQARAVLQVWSNLRGSAGETTQDIDVEELLKVAALDSQETGGFVRLFDALKAK